MSVRPSVSTSYVHVQVFFTFSTLTYQASNFLTPKQQGVSTASRRLPLYLSICPSVCEGGKIAMVERVAGLFPFGDARALNFPTIWAASNRWARELGPTQAHCSSLLLFLLHNTSILTHTHTHTLLLTKTN